MQKTVLEWSWCEHAEFSARSVSGPQHPLLQRDARLPSVCGCERCYLGRVYSFPVGVSRLRERSAAPSSRFSRQVMEHCSARYSGCCADKLIPSMIKLSINGTTGERRGHCRWLLLRRSHFQFQFDLCSCKIFDHQFWFNWLHRHCLIIFY